MYKSAAASFGFELGISGGLEPSLTRLGFIQLNQRLKENMDDEIDPDKLI